MLFVVWLLRVAGCLLFRCVLIAVRCLLRVQYRMMCVALVSTVCFCCVLVVVVCCALFGVCCVLLCVLCCLLCDPWCSLSSVVCCLLFVVVIVC